MIYLDDGSTGTKVGFVNGENKIEFRTVTNRAELGRGVSDSGLSSTYSIDGQNYTFYEQCDALKTSNAQYQYSQHNVAAVHHALHECGFSGKTVDICVTLPISQFFESGRVNVANIEKKKANLLTPVLPEDQEQIIIRSVKLYPEGIPAVQPLICDPNGNSKVDSDELTFIGDIGGTTLDLAIFSGAAERIIKAQSFDIGMLECSDSIKLASGRSGLRDMQVQRLLETGECANGKVKIDRVAVSKPIMTKAASTIINFLGKDIDSLSYSYLIGGGSELLQMSLNDREFEAELVPNSTLALVQAIAKIEEANRG
ncbi:hypothetical protein UA32_11885 [Photobacterium angustum]|nr:plasmid segregation protein ParM domain-containing protein [Photobacterium angustum]KJG37660.1 hypothetical protein UA32_11885 [Photobacterium angustum]